MNAIERLALWQQLEAAALVEGECPPAAVTGTPWFVRLMLGLGGWLGALFLLLFVGAALGELLNAAGVSLLLGMLLCGAAAAIFQAAGQGEFLAQFALALSLAGQGLVLHGLARSFHSDVASIAVLLALFETILFFVVANFVHRVWSALIGAAAIAYALADAQLAGLAPGLMAGACALLWLQESATAREGPLLRAAGYGLVLALLFCLVLLMLGDGPWRGRGSAGVTPALWLARWVGAALSGGVLVATTAQLLARAGLGAASPSGSSALLAAGLLAVAGLWAPGLAPASLLLLLGHGQGNRLLLGCGIAALLAYLWGYYYLLQPPLLHKSLLLAGCGSALLAIRGLRLRSTGGQADA